MFSNDWSTDLSLNPLYHAFILLKKQLSFWTIAKCLSYSATRNCPDFFSFFIGSIPRLEDQSKVKYLLRLHLNVKKVASASQGSIWSKKCESLGSSKKVANGFSFVSQNAYELLKDVMVEKIWIVMIDQKSCTRLLICGSECICSSVFGWFCII